MALRTTIIVMIGLMFLLGTQSEIKRAIPARVIEISKTDLGHRVRIFVPSTGNSSLHGTSDHDWPLRVAGDFTAWFGGSTAYDAHGTWFDGKKVHREPVCVIESFCKESQLRESLPSLLALCRLICSELRQQCIALEVDGELRFIELPQE